MSPFSHSILLEGRSIPSQTAVRLHCGGLTMLLEPTTGFLRQIRYGETLVLNGVYAAVRDQNWDTVSPAIRELTIDQNPDRFTVTFVADCRKNDVDFTWRGGISGTTDGGIQYQFDGVANTEFLRNRIGLCVLHDARDAGQWCVIEHVDGTKTTAVFPKLVSPHQPFKMIRAITHFPTVIGRQNPPEKPAPSVEVRMEGDAFEMEDQRNWTDNSFKIYSTPLEILFPVRISCGARIRQTITIRPAGFPNVQESDTVTFERFSETPAGTEDRRDASASIEQLLRSGNTGAAFHRLPRLGFCIASHEQSLNDEQAQCLRVLQPNHLRCDLAPLESDWEARWKEAVRQAHRLNCRLHVALHLRGRGDEARTRSQIDAVAAMVGYGSPVDVWLIFAEGERATDSKWTGLARELLADAGGLIFGGTDANFVELNRHRPTGKSADGVSWSVNPQVHLTDNLTLVESLGAQWATVEAARGFYPGELMVSPVTLKPRLNTDAATRPGPLPPDVLPPEVDVRQMSLFGAAWTLGSIASLSREPALRSITYFETTGWRGVMEWAERPRLPHKFVTRPGWVFPLYHVFALLAGFDECMPVETDSFSCSALMLRHAGQPTKGRLVLASFAPDPVQLKLQSVFTPERRLVLGPENAIAAMRDSQSFLAAGWTKSPPALNVTLPPCSLVAIDGQLG